MNQGYEKQTLHFRASKWIEVVPDECMEASTLSLENEIILLIKNSATSGEIIISEASPIKNWADEILGEYKFGWVDIRIAENEYYPIEFRYRQ